MSKLHHQCPALVPAPEEASFLYRKGMCCWDQAAVTLAHSGYHFTISLLEERQQRALFQRGLPQTHGPAESALFSQVALYLEKSLLSASTGSTHMPVQAWSAQNSTVPKKALCGQVTATETVQMSLPTWYFRTNCACSSHYKFVLHQEEVCANKVSKLISHINI